MIKIVDYASIYKHRAAGWIQDASSLSNLHRFVSIFSHASPYRTELVNKISVLVELQLASRFSGLLQNSTIILTYRDIVGSAPKTGSRKQNTVCNGIGQAALIGQRRSYQADWSTDSFLRWAQVLEFIEHSPSDDTYRITPTGEAYVQARSQAQQLQIFKQQLIKYPPAIRILTLLKETEGTKFYLGEKLGFVGEKGFTNVSEKLFVDLYFVTDSPKARRILVQNYEGTSDKYARQICSWLLKVSLLEKSEGTYQRNGECLVLARYKITPQGREFLRKASIANHRVVPFGMLSMDIQAARELVCKRRALVLKALSSGLSSIGDIISVEAQHGITTVPPVLVDDIRSLQNMGLNIVAGGYGYHLEDTIDGLYIPRKVAPVRSSEVAAIKERLRSELTHLDHSLLVLIDFAYGGNAMSRNFETYVAKSYEQLYPDTFLLGGTSKPDVVVCADRLVIIVDAKAYGGGFSLPISEQDKMVRYIEEYKMKDNRWYDIVKGSITTDHPAFQFVSSEFNGVAEKLVGISRRSGVNGSAVSAENLLRLIDGALAKNTGLDVSTLTSNRQIYSI